MATGGSKLRSMSKADPDQPCPIDEIAMVNDSVPRATPRRRKLHVAKWLRGKLKQLGM